MTKRTIDTSDKGKELLEQYIKEVGLLAGLTIEMFDENRNLLLSPNFRELTRLQGVKVKELHSKLHLYLCVDYLHNE